MKKLTRQNKRYNLRHSKREFRKKIKRKKKHYYGVDYINRNVANVNTQTGGYLTPYPHYVGAPILKYTDIVAPELFNLQYENCEPVIHYVNLIKKKARQGKNLNIALNDIKDLGEGAISMLLSVLNEIRAIRIAVRGEKPKDQTCKDFLERSGFFREIETKLEEKNINSKNTILRTQGIRGSTINLSAEIKTANDTVWGVAGRNPPLRGTVFEMMRNSWDHAFDNKLPHIMHLGISHSEKDNVVKFSFVDNGIGILNSLRTNSLKAVIRHFKDNADILETAFKNGIESRTGLSYRGKGLPTIYETLTDGYLENLVVISNDVYLDFEKQKSKTMDAKFVGTYYYWKLSQNCTKACYI